MSAQEKSERTLQPQDLISASIYGVVCAVSLIVYIITNVITIDKSGKIELTFSYTTVEWVLFGLKALVNPVITILASRMAQGLFIELGKNTYRDIIDQYNEILYEVESEKSQIISQAEYLKRGIAKDYSIKICFVIFSTLFTSMFVEMIVARVNWFSLICNLLVWIIFAGIASYKAYAFSTVYLKQYYIIQIRRLKAETVAETVKNTTIPEV